MLVSFAAGGLLGVVLERRIGLTSLVVPIVLLIVLALTRQHYIVDVEGTDTDVSHA